MAVDVDAYLESLGPPKLTIGGETLVGRHLSLEEWLPFESQFQKLSEMGQQGFDIEVWHKLVRDFCFLAFPATIWQALNPRYKPVGARIRLLPPAAQYKVMKDFFESQQRALGVRGALENSEEAEES